jgi:hypothetical protein
MILAGLALGAAVWATWPEPSTRIVRLPYGEASPKTPREAVEPRPAARAPSVVAPTAESPREVAEIVETEEPGRVLAAVEPEAEADVEPEATRAPAAVWAGPDPIPSEWELRGDYEQEPPEELGAEPLPGVDLTLLPPPASR